MGDRKLAEFIVTSLGDADVAGELTLRQAIEDANATAGADVIRFDASLLGGVVVLTQGDLEILDDLIIDGDIGADGTADITIDAQGGSRALTLTSGSTGIEGLSIVGGYDATEGGGGILVGSAASLSTFNTTIANNTSYVGGGGIRALGDVTLVNTTISGNEGGISGGGLDTSYSATLVNVTIANNNASYGGGVYVFDGSLTAEHVTITGNTAYYGGGLYNFGPYTTLTNSIVLGNYAAYDPEVAQAGGYAPQYVAFNGLNIVGEDPNAFDASISPNVVNARPDEVFALTDNGIGVDAGVLGNNGGAVQTVALLNDAENIALDAAAAVADQQDADRDGDTAEDLPVDARGVQRAPGAADLGAFEVEQAALQISLNAGSVTEGGTVTGTVTRNVVTNTDLVVTLVSDDLSEALVPPTITILANQATASFTLTSVDDPIEDGTQTVNISATAAGLVGASAQLDVLDDDVVLAAGDIQLTDTSERLLAFDPNANRVIGGDGIDVILTDAGADIIDGGLGSDTIISGAGADVLIGGAGNDVLTGGADTDVFVIDANDFGAFGGDTITDFESGVDTIELSGFTEFNDPADLTYNSIGGNLIIDLGSNRLVVLQGFTDQSELQAGDISFVGAPQTLSFNITPTVLTLTDSNDRYVNTGDINGLTVNAGGGVDVVITGDGDDTVFGGAGSDTMVSGGGADELIGGLGNDTMTGGAGADQFTFSVLDFVGPTGDQITDFTIGLDVIELQGFGVTTVGDLNFVNTALGDAIELSANQLIILAGVDSNNLTDGDFIFA